MSNIEKRIEHAVQIVSSMNPHKLDVISDISPEELARISLDMELKPEQMSELAGIIVYIRNRIIEKKSRVDSFRIAFPERCIVSGDDKYVGRYETEGKEVGSPLHKTTIDIKAKRLENKKIYLHVYDMLQTNLYVTYALDRLRVLDEVLNSAMDRDMPSRDRHNYMKLFLDETRKPENSKQLEVTMNLQQNNINVASVEDKMNTIAQALNHASASEVLDIIGVVKNDKSED